MPSPAPRPAPDPPSTARVRRIALVMWMAAGLALGPLTAPPAAYGAEPASSSAAKSQSGGDRAGVDRGLVLLGCMAGFAVGTVSLVLPPTSAWVAAGVWAGGFGTMIMRAGFGCIYGGLGGAVASMARNFVRWIDAGWKSWKGRPEPKPLAIEAPSAS